jgi:thioredoxin-dependent peroxiredoxin
MSTKENNLISGQSAPQWQAVALQQENEVTISSETLQNQGYILYFYPKDNTPGCTTQACDFRDEWRSLKALGYQIFGVSPDSLKSHDKFQKKYELPFALITDPEHELAESFNVWQEKKNYGRIYMGIVRSTFIIDTQGAILHALYNVRAKGHVKRVHDLLTSSK